MAAKARNQAEEVMASAPEKRPAFEPPVLHGPTPIESGLFNQPSPIVPGTAFTPRPAPVDDPRQRLADERARMATQRDAQQAAMSRALEQARMPQNGTYWVDLSSHTGIVLDQPVSKIPILWLP